MFGQLPFELMMKIFKFVDSGTVVSLSLDGLKSKGFFSFLTFEEKFWMKIMRKEIGLYPCQFELPLNILMEERVVEQYENNAFFRYLLLSKFEERLETFLLSSYQEKYYLLSGNLERDKFFTFQLQLPSQNCNLFSWKEQPFLKGKIYLQGNLPSNCSLTVRGRMPMSKEGITIQINWKCDPKKAWRYNPKAGVDEISINQIGDIYFTFISEAWGPKFPISSSRSYYPYHRPITTFSVPKTTDHEKYILAFFGNQVRVDGVNNYVKQNSDFLFEAFLTIIKRITSNNSAPFSSNS